MNKVIVLQGVSGSGKSTWAKAQARAVSVSADELFYQPDGSYVWDEGRLSEAHNRCLRKFAGLLTSPYSSFEPHLMPGVSGPLNAQGLVEADTVIVDNTNTRAIFMAPYVALARAYGLPVEIHSFRVPIEVCAARNNGRAPLSVIREMAESIENFTMPEVWTKDDVQYIVHPYPDGNL